MISSKGRRCGDVGLVESQKSRRDAGVTESPAGCWGSFLLLVHALIGRFDERLLLGVDALQDAEKIGAAVWTCASVCKVNDGSIFASWIGYERVGADCAYGPEEIGVQALSFSWQIEVVNRVFVDELV